jgi:4-amino-4-deoxy-L-arabinose transferase-like glycosyltransferase
MNWQFTKWYAAHRPRRDKWDHITLIVFVAAGILILGRYPLYIVFAVSLPVALLVGWLLGRRRIRKMRLS